LTAATAWAAGETPPAIQTPKKKKACSSPIQHADCEFIGNENAWSDWKGTLRRHRRIAMKTLGIPVD
jgi:hypothetical protein